MSPLVTVALVFAIAFAIAGIWACVEAIRAFRSARSLTDEMAENLPPLVEKVDLTVDVVNAELLRIDSVVTRFEEVSESVSATTSAVHGAVNVPREMVSGLAQRIARILAERRARAHG